MKLDKAIHLAGAPVVGVRKGRGTVNGVEKDIMWIRFRLPPWFAELSIGDMEIARNLTKTQKLNLVKTRLINNVYEFIDTLEDILE